MHRVALRPRAPLRSALQTRLVAAPQCHIAATAFAAASAAASAQRGLHAAAAAAPARAAAVTTLRRSPSSISALLSSSAHLPLSAAHGRLVLPRATGARLFHASRTAGSAPAGSNGEEQAAAFVEASAEQQAAWNKPPAAAASSSSEGAEGDIPLDGEGSGTSGSGGDHEGDQAYQESPLRRILGRLKWPLFWGVFLGGGYYFFAPDHPAEGPWYGGITKAFQEIGMEYSLLPPQADPPIYTGQPYRTLVIVPEDLLWVPSFSYFSGQWDIDMNPGTVEFLGRVRDLGFEVVLWSSAQHAEPLDTTLKWLNHQVHSQHDDKLPDETEEEETGEDSPLTAAPAVAHGLGADNTAVGIDWEGNERLLRDLNRIARPLEHTLAFDAHQNAFTKPADGKQHVILVPKFLVPGTHKDSRLPFTPEQRKLMKQREQAGLEVLDRILIILEGIVDYDIRDMSVIASRANSGPITRESLFAPEIAAVPPQPDVSGLSESERQAALQRWHEQVAQVRPAPWPRNEKQRQELEARMQGTRAEALQQGLLVPASELEHEPEPVHVHELAIDPMSAPGMLAPSAADLAVQAALEKRIAERKATLEQASPELLEALHMKEDALALGATEEKAEEIKQRRLRGEIKPASFPWIRALFGQDIFETIKTDKQ